MRKGFKKVMSFVLSAAMMVSLGSGMTFSTASAEGAADTTKEAAAAASTVTYGAVVGFQTYNQYDFRNGYEQQEADARYGEWLVQNGKEAAPAEYNGINIYRNGNGPEIYEKGDKKGQLKVDKAEKAELCTGAAVTDAVMDKDGKYTVSIKNLDLKKEADVKQTFSMLDVSTNIIKDVHNKNVTAKATSIKINGEEIAKDVDLPVKADIADGAYYKFMFANGYSIGDKTANVKFPQLSDADASTGLAVPSGLIDIEITFELKGVDWTYVPVKPTEAPETTAAPVTAPPEVPLSTSFDMYLSANVNEALTPSAGPDIRMDEQNKAIQAASFGSEAMKTKVTTAKSAKGNALFDAKTMDYIVSDSSSTTISKTGEYSLSVTARSNMEDMTSDGAAWFPILINGSTGVMPKDFNIKATKLIVGEGASAKEYAWTAQLMQDANGDVRLSVFNKWATDNEKAAANTIKDMVPVKKGDKITFKFYVVPGAPAPATTPTPEAIGPSTSYMSYLGFQTDDWMFRDTWQSDTGLKCKDYDYKKQVGWSHEGKTNAVDVKSITDAKMTKNGAKYKVAITGLDIKKTSKNSTKFNMLYLSTDIPLSMKGVTVKDAVLKIDGKTVKEYKVVPNKGDASKYYQFMLADAYAPADGTKDAPYPSGKELKTFPTDSIEIEYVIDGVDFNSKTVTVGNFKYKLTKNTAQVVGLSKAGKKKANLSLGKTIKVASASAVSTQPAVKKTYKVTSVKAGAFKGSSKLKSFSFKKAVNIKKLPAKAFMNCKKLKKVELNKNMKSIPAKAFAGCKKLSTIKCNAKLKSASKSAFKGCKKKIKIAGKSAKANKKKIKKAYKKVK